LVSTFTSTSFETILFISFGAVISLKFFVGKSKLNLFCDGVGEAGVIEIEET
jgi:hypothetical protein